MADLLAPLVRRIVAPLWARWERSPYLRIYRGLLRTQYDSPEVVGERQFRAARDIVAHAYATTTFWKRRCDALGITPDDIRAAADFAALPLTTKDDLRSSGEEMLAAGYRRESLHVKTTSGSTGVSVRVYVDDAAQQWKRACALRSDEWSGWRLGERVAKVWGNPEYLRRGARGRLRNALLERATYLDTLHMNELALERFVTALRRRPPSLLFGHAHSLFLLAEYLRTRGNPGIRPRGIISTAMVLHAWQRRGIEDVFACPVTNRYGCEEVSLIACECPEHDGLHVNADGVLVEVLRPDGLPAEPGEAGSVVVTDLVNRAMPLIRYQVGDMAVFSQRRCRCGRGLPLLERIEGREADYVVTSDGGLISGISLTENFALLVPGVAQLQIVQEEIDRFLFRIVRGEDYGPASDERLRELVAERFGRDARYACEFVPQIPREASGKYRFCVSRVANPFSARRPVAATVEAEVP